MATDQKIDPITRDFVDLPNGDWEEVNDASTAIFCQLDSEQGAWFGDSEAGSRNAEILRSSDPVEPEELQDSTKRALNAIAADGLITDQRVTIDGVDSARGFGQLLIEWFDRASNSGSDLSYTPLGGAPP